MISIFQTGTQDFPRIPLKNFSSNPNLEILIQKKFPIIFDPILANYRFAEILVQFIQSYLGDKQSGNIKDMVWEIFLFRVLSSIGDVPTCLFLDK